MVYALYMCCILQVYTAYFTYYKYIQHISQLTYHVLAPVTSHSILIEQSINKKSIKTQECSTNLSVTKYESLQVKSLICCTRMSMHKWYSSVCLSASHSVVWATVAALDMAGIIPRSRQAYAVPDTVQSLLLLATAKNRV